MGNILDQFGRPVRAATKSELLDEQSGPLVGSVRQVTSGHPADGLEPRRLASILRSAEMGDATAYLHMAEQMEEKDLHYGAVLGVRKRAIRGLDLVVEPGDDSDAAIEAADVTRQALTSPATKEAFIDILDALGKGYSVSEIVWDISGRLFQIAAIEHRPPEWFQFDQVNGRHLTLRGSGAGQELHPDKYVIHLPRIKSGVPIRGGLARMACWAFMFKNFTVKDWSIFLEAYGHPLRLGKYDPALASDADKRTLLRAARAIGADMAAIIPHNMELEVIAARSTANEGYEKSARWWDEQLSKGVLGQVATTDAIAGGHAVGRIHEAVRDDIRDSDADQLALTLMHDIARPLTRHNFGQTVPAPLVRFQSPERIVPEQLLRLMEVAGPAGLRIAKSDVYRAFSLREPDAEDDVLTFGPQPGATPAPPIRQMAARQHDHVHDDPIRDLINELVENGRMAGAMESDIGPLVDAITHAASFDEIARLLDHAGLDVPGMMMRDLLAQALFSARMGGQMGA
ncbi:DUF935 domain-containing protein [Paracoccus sp. (in: a-proteobacteria)]|uniref:DUF935 domain-containing protein n=1 Tax=Paracoccus sp. TaxID=267 RepID=UPI0026DF89FF|nr:DUF935 family protein [Paracoccus sp. (in: a-proteobacteria)]MDO5648853.1 DUF935 family protein [Paracoccus sp. (in: a-proteobacteria)]